MTTSRKTLRRESGFTIVELMVGMLIGLISIVVMFQVFAVSEGQRRTTTGAGDAQQNGVTSLYLMGRDARLAGYGINYFRLLGCTVNGYWSPTAQPFSFTLLPAMIQNGLASAPDTLTFAYAGTDTYTFPSILSNDTAASAPGFLKIRDQRFAYRTGDLFVVGEVPAAGAALAKPCSLFQVTQLPDPTTTMNGDSQQITFNGSSYVDSGGVTRTAPYTPPSASASTQLPPNNTYYARWSKQTNSGSRIFNLGAEPTVVQYSIVNNQLIATNLLRPADPPIVVSDGIVQLQAQYGYSAHDTFNGALPGCNPLSSTLAACTVSPTAASVATIALGNNDQWGDAVPAGMTPNDWRRIVAVRFVVVARSGQQEKPDPATGQCTATTVQPTWVATGQTLDIASANPTTWKCYRYKTFETVMPMRNFNYFPDPTGSNEAPA